MKFRIKSKSKTIFLVFEDNKVWGILPEKVLHFFSLTPGKNIELDEGLRSKLFKEIEKFAWEKLLNYITFQERSIWECENYLKKLPLEINMAEKLIKKAISLNFINDTRFTELMVESLLEKGKSSIETRNKLFQKHIEENIINDIISKYYTSENKIEILEKNLDKALKRYSRFPDKKKIEKTLNYLTRKGFSYWEVKEMLEKKITNKR